MAENRIHVKITNSAGREEFDVPSGTSYGDIVEQTQAENGLDVLLVFANGKLQEIHRKANQDCTLQLVTAADQIGMDTYKRSLNLVFLKAVYDILPSPVHVSLRFSNGNGYFYTIRGEKCLEITEKEAALVRSRMREIVEARIPVHKRTVSTDYARDFFHAVGMEDKAKLFRYRRISSVNLYNVENFQDYFYGYMVQNTGYLRYFDVTSYEGGLVLVLPDPANPTEVHPFEPFPKIFQVQTRAEKWAARIGVNSVGDLNDVITEGRIEHELLVTEALQEGEISDIAQEIKRRGNVKFAMIAGPSSSGKTTFSRRLSIQLSAHGLIPHPISLDNFYLDRKYCPKDAEGNYDFESLDALDVPLIRQTLSDLMDGKEVELPRFNFLTGGREYKGDRLQLGENDILVIEGIHGLNRKLCEGIDESGVFRIYISALTQLNVDEHNHISTTDGRLIRRIVRDYRTRGTDAEETIRRWPSVRRGEVNYIFPNQENADVMFNSALLYELAVLKVYAEPLLFQVREDSPSYPEAKRLLKFLDYFLGVPSESVPKNSILREFIGGSCFDV